MTRPHLTPKRWSARWIWGLASLLAFIASILTIVDILGLAWTVAIVSLSFTVATILYVSPRFFREEIEELRNQLDVVTRNANREIIEEQTLTLEVADRGGDTDREIIEFSTRALPPAPCLWRRVSYWSSDSPPGARGFNVKLLKGKGTLITLTSDSTTWTGVFFFDPPIGPNEEPRQWGLIAEWPGLANPLRHKGEDKLVFRTQMTLSRLALRVRIPVTWGSLPDSFERVFPPVGTQKCTRDRSGVTLEWCVDEPDRGVEFTAYFRASVE